MAVVELDHEGRVAGLNAAARELLRGAIRLADAVDARDRERLLGHLDHARTTEEHQRTHLELVVGGVPTLVTSRRVGTDGSVLCALTEVTDLHQRTRDLELRAFSDPLTGLANRSLLPGA